MTDRRVVVLSEGPNEIGREKQPIQADANLPALPRLVHRLLGKPLGVTYQAGKLKNVAHVRGYKKKVIAAIRQARTDSAAGLAVVVDRDGAGNSDRLSELRNGRDALEAEFSVPCAVGVAVEEFDAWMIADGKALAAAADDGKPQAHNNPESLGPGKAKDHAREQLGRAGSDKYAAVASQADLKLLKRKCPKGFGAFAKEVARYIAPVFDGN